MQNSELLRLSAEIVSAHVAHNTVPVDALPGLIRSVYAALGNVAPPLEAIAQTPSVAIKKSVFPSYLVCLEDGKKLSMLKRHLQTSYGMTPDAYRAKWGLPDSYPMVASDYAARRSALAKEFGFGRISSASVTIEAESVPAPVMPEITVQKIPARKRGRKPGSKNAKLAEAEATAD